MKHIKSFNLEKWISNQVQVWEGAKNVQEKSEEIRPFITVSREYGCRAASKIILLAEELNKVENHDFWHAYDKTLLDKIVEDEGVNQKLIETLDTKKREEMGELMRNALTDYPPQVAAYKKLIKTIRTLAIQGRNIFVGRASEVITKDMKYGIHIKFIAPLSYRVKTVMETQGIKSRMEAEKYVKTKEEERHQFMTQYIHFDSYNATNYDLIINIDKFTDKEIVDMIICGLKGKGYLKV